MEEVGFILKNWPAAAGSIPMWGVFFMVLVIAIRTSPQWLDTWSKMKLAKAQRVAGRINELEARLAACEKECAERERSLHNEIQGLRQQRNAEQLVIMRAIVSMSGDPQVKQQLELLEAMEIGLKAGLEEGASNGAS
jgi:membrane protein insertase Oxa1/YidC/SpoIIIJ